MFKGHQQIPSTYYEELTAEFIHNVEEGRLLDRRF